MTFQASYLSPSRHAPRGAHALLIVLLTCSALVGCRVETSADDIRAMGARGDGAALSRFLAQNQHQASPTVVLAVHEVLTRRITGAYPLLSGELESQSPLGALALAVLDSTGAAPHDAGAVLEYLSESYGADTLRAARVAKRISEDEHVAWFKEHFVDDLRMTGGAYDGLASAARRHSLVDGPRRERFVAFGRDIAARAAILHEIDEVTAEVRRLGSGITPEVAAVEHSVILSGFVVAEDGVSSGIYRYEIASPQLSTRAILKRPGASFTSQGRFSLPVVQEGTVEVTLNENFGGFTQQWPVFREVRESEATAYHAFKAATREVNGRLADLRARMTALGEPRPL